MAPSGKTNGQRGSTFGNEFGAKTILHPDEVYQGVAWELREPRSEEGRPEVSSQIVAPGSNPGGSGFVLTPRWSYTGSALVHRSDYGGTALVVL